MITNKHTAKLSPFILALIVGLGVFLRTYKLHEALGDWHSWRQADTASVAREYVKAGRIDLFAPRFHDLSSIPSGLDNPQGYRMVEFPLRDALHAQLVMWFPQVGLVEWGRLISIGASAVTIVLLYALVASLSGRLAAILTALVYAILPYSMYYGRVILPEPFLVMWTLAALVSYLEYLHARRVAWYLLALLSLTLAILMKPTALTIVIPMILAFLVTRPFPWKQALPSLLLPALALIPYYFWRRYIAAYPAGIPANSWLFNSNGIRFKGAWFRWLFGERIGKLILGYWGLIPFGFGLAKLGAHKKETAVYGGLLLGSLSYLAIIATGNVQHDYYQIQILPTLAVFVGVGWAYLISLKRSWVGRGVMLSFGGLIMILAAALSWYEVKGYFWVNNRAMVAAGAYVDAHTPADSLVIAPYMGDTAFLFQTNRRGWPIGGDIEGKIKQGATYYVTTTRDAEYNEVKAHYTLIYENDAYSIIKLSK